MLKGAKIVVQQPDDCEEGGVKVLHWQDEDSTMPLNLGMKLLSLFPDRQGVDGLVSGNAHYAPDLDFCVEMWYGADAEKDIDSVGFIYYYNLSCTWYVGMMDLGLWVRLDSIMDDEPPIEDVDDEKDERIQFLETVLRDTWCDLGALATNLSKAGVEDL